MVRNYSIILLRDNKKMNFIDKMAADLGIYRYNCEEITAYKCRVIYSALSSWVKTIAMDQPIGSKENHLSGVSRKHIYERGNAVLEALIKINPETSSWFDVEETEENPVVIIRNRLLNHGDLLNEEFDTNLTLPLAHKKQFISGYDTVYGEVLGKNIMYSGIATICNNDVEIRTDSKERCEEWLNSFLQSIWWSAMPIEISECMFFNPKHKSRNNYSAWDNLPPNISDEIILCRVTINRNGYEYYLIKPKSRLMHKIDPFLQEQGYHIRIMYALRKKANNSVVAIIKNYGNHIYLKLSTHLPTNERILLESYAWPFRRINDMLCWTMYDYIWDYIKPYFESIGIQIMEK